MTVRIHQLGAGVSQVLAPAAMTCRCIGGISMLHGLAALDADPSTSVIILVSKPPAPEIARQVLAAAEASAKPVVVIFLGADPASITRKGVYGAAYLAQAADMAVALAKGGKASAATIAVSEMRRTLAELALRWPQSAYVRGIFSGDARSVSRRSLRAAGIRRSQTRRGNLPLPATEKTAEHHHRHG